MNKSMPSTPRSIASPLAVLSLLSLAACGGGIGGEPPKQAMNLSQVNLNCVQQPGETCNNVQATVMLYPDVTDQRPLWEEKPAAGGTQVFERAKPIKQADGSWIMDFSVKPGLAEGTYTGTVDFSVLVSPYPGTPNYQPRTASYRIVVVGLKGQLSSLQALPGAGDWEGTNGNAAQTGQVPVSLDASKFSRRWTWEYDGGGNPYSVSQVVTANGLVYLSVEHRLADVPGSSNYIYSNTLIALSEQDSTVKWRTGQTASKGFSAPGVSGKRLVMVEPNTVYTFDAISGTNLGTVKQTQMMDNTMNAWSELSPTLANGNAYIGGTKGLLSADGTTAQNLWFTSFGFPSLMHVSEWGPAVNDTMLYSNTIGFSAYSRADGKWQWGLSVPGTVDGSFNRRSLRQTPVLPDDHTVLLPNQRPYPGQTRTNSMSLVDTDIRALRWTVEGAFTTKPVTAQGVLYVGNMATAALEARSLATGAVLWSWPLSAVQEKSFGGDLIVTNNLLFVAGENGTYALDLSSHKAVWNFYLTGKLSLSRNGVLYIRTVHPTSTGLARVTAINLQ